MNSLDKQFFSYCSSLQLEMGDERRQLNADLHAEFITFCSADCIFKVGLQMISNTWAVCWLPLPATAHTSHPRLNGLAKYRHMHVSSWFSNLIRPSVLFVILLLDLDDRFFSLSFLVLPLANNYIICYATMAMVHLEKRGNLKCVCNRVLVCAVCCAEACSPDRIPREPTDMQW